MSETNWKSINIDNLLSIERQVDEYLIFINRLMFTLRFRIYERTDNRFYAVADITLKNPQTGEYVRPRGEGNSPSKCLKNAILHLHALLLALPDDLTENKEYIRSLSNEY